MCLNHLSASSLLRCEKCHDSVLGSVITLYSLTLHTFLCLSFLLLVFKILKSHRLTSPALGSFLRSDSYPKMSKKSAATPNLHLKLNSDIHSDKISSSTGLSHLDKSQLYYSTSKVRDLENFLLVCKKTY